MPTPQHPFFSFFPALPLSKTLRLGDWCIGYPAPEVPWRSTRFKELALAHLKTFEKQGFKNAALMWHCERGFDGSMPQPEVWAAIRATICFVVLDGNDHVRNDLNAGHYIATSENAELFTQPIDEEQAFITYQTGGLLKRVLSGGWRIGDEAATAHLPDAVVAIEGRVIPSQIHATALFDALLDTRNAAFRRIAVALEWHRFALSNPRAISLPQRLISLKTGFEALSGQSATHLCGAFLRRLFEDVTRPHVDLLPWAGILWSPKERTDLQRTWMRNNTPQPVVRSELEDWFATLGSARNEIIHEGTLSTVEYAAPTERPLSRYVGQLFWTADRMLRETVKALLGADVLLSARLKELEFWKKLGAALRAEREAVANGAPPPQAGSNDGETPADEDESGPVLDPSDLETAAPANGDEIEHVPEEAASVAPTGDIGTRDLSQLLSALNCDAANKVRLEKPAGSERRLWGASFAKRTIGIDEGEKNLLQSAGAEFPLPPTWSRAD